MTTTGSRVPTGRPDASAGRWRLPRSTVPSDIEIARSRSTTVPGYCAGRGFHDDVAAAGAVAAVTGAVLAGVGAARVGAATAGLATVPRQAVTRATASAAAKRRVRRGMGPS